MHRATPLLLGALCLFAPGCGSEESQIERGLAEHDQASTPESPADMKKTEAQRQQEVVDDMQKKQIENFDAENGKPQ